MPQSTLGCSHEMVCRCTKGLEYHNGVFSPTRGSSNMLKVPKSAERYPSLIGQNQNATPHQKVELNTNSKLLAFMFQLGLFSNMQPGVLPCLGTAAENRLMEPCANQNDKKALKYPTMARSIAFPSISTIHFCCSSVRLEFHHGRRPMCKV